MKTIICQGNLWVNVEVLHFNDKQVEDVIFSVKEHAQNNNITLVDIEYTKAKYVVFYRISGVSRTDCRIYRDMLIDLLSPIAVNKKVEIVNEQFL